MAPPNVGVPVSWTGSTSPYPRERCLHDLFSEQARLHPDRVAVAWRDHRYTYAEVEGLSNSIAATLRDLGLERGAVVAVCQDRSADAIVFMVAVIKAGGVYLALDATLPDERLRFQVEDSGAARVFVDSANAARFATFDVPVSTLDPASWSSRKDRGSAANDPEDAMQAAHLMYTSGSTGRPKGALIPHRAIVRLVRETNYTTLRPDDTVLQLGFLGFDPVFFEVWGTLLAGARLLVGAEPRNIAGTAALIRAERVTVFFVTPAYFNHLVDFHAEDLVGVRQILVGGETMSRTHARRALEMLPRTEILNTYGPTENATFTTTHSVRLEDCGGPIPLGRPIANTQVFILDGEMRPVPVGIAGELCASGDGLALAYLNRPELNAQRFITLPGSQLGLGDDTPVRLYRCGDGARWREDGLIDFLGRLDRQIKFRGLRLEPEELESALREHPSIHDAAIALENAGTVEARLVAWIACPRDPIPSHHELRRHLETRIALSFVPSLFVAVREMPMNTNGKVDFGALRERLASVAPRPGLGSASGEESDALARVLTMMREALGSDALGPDDDFFAAGGHSLLAAKLMARIERAFARRIDAVRSFERPTARRLATLLEEPVGEALPPGLVKWRDGSEGPPLIFAYGIEGHPLNPSALVPHLPENLGVYLLRSADLLDEPGREVSLEELAARCVSDLIDAFPRGPFRLAGYSFAGTLAFEMAIQLIAQGREVAFLGLIDRDAGFLIGPWLLNTRSGHAHGGLRPGHEAALRRYVPGWCPVRIDLFVTRDQDSDRYFLPDTGWGLLSSDPPIVHEVAGTHLDLFFEPQVARLGAALRHALAAAQTRPPVEHRRPDAAQLWTEPRRLAGRGEFVALFDWYLERVSVEPTAPGWVYENLARLAQALKRIDAVAPLFERLLDGEHEDATLAFVARGLLGPWLLSRGETARAEAMLRWLKDRPATSAEHYRHWSTALADLGRLSEAVSAARHAVDKHGDAWWLHSHLAWILLRADALTPARAAAARALELTHEPAWPLRFMSEILDRLGDYEGAVAHARHAVEAAPEEPAMSQYLQGLISRGRPTSDSAEVGTRAPE